MRSIVLTLAVLGLMSLAACSSEPKATTMADGSLAVPLADLADGQARHYDVALDGKTVRFFLVRTPDGVIRAAFDACDVCYPERKGYSQSGEYMICDNCGQRFHASRINVVSGGCNPAPLTREVVDGSVVLRADDLRAGLRFF